MGRLTHCPDCNRMLVGERLSFCPFCLESFKKVDIRFFSTKRFREIDHNHSPLY